MTLGVIIVCYNSEKTIYKTLKSIEIQSVIPDEIVVVDGGSQDGTLYIVNEYKHLPIKLISENDNGIYNAMNKGLRTFSTDIVGFLNSDDAFHDNTCISRIKKSFEESLKIKIFTSGVNYLNADNFIIREWRVNSLDVDFFSGGHVPHPGFYVRRDIVEDIGEFNESYIIASDFDFMLRALQNVNLDEIYIDNGVLVNMLEGGTSNQSLKNILKGNSEVRHSLRSNGYNVNFIYTIKRLYHKLIQRFL